MIPIADLIITNGRVLTSDEKKPHAEAVAIKGNRILHAGTNKDVLGFQGKNTRVIDARGCTVIPGFIDSHFHLLWDSVWMGSAQLYNAKTKDDVKIILQDFTAQNKTAGPSLINITSMFQ